MKMRPNEYLKLAAVEDRMWYFRALHNAIGAQLARRLPPTADVLDAGCGTGGLIRRLAPLHPGWKWTGLDVEQTALATARGRARGSATFVEGLLEALPFPSNSFDAVTSADVLYQVEDETEAMRETARILRPGGIFVLNVPAYRWLWSYHDDAVGSLRRYTDAEVRAKLAAAGFDSIRTSYRLMLSLPLVILRRKLLPKPSGGSDVGLMPAPVDAALGALAAAEDRLVGAGRSLPFGSSVFAVARRG